MLRLAAVGQFLRRNPLKVVAAGLSLAVISVACALVGNQWQAWRQYRLAEAALLRASQQHLDRNLALARLHGDRYLQLRPKSPEGHLLAARANRRQGEFDRSLQHLSQAEQLGADAQAISLERDLVRAQQGAAPTGVEARLKQLVDQYHPESTAILEAMAPGYLKTFQLPCALACLDLWLELVPDNVHALLLRGQANRQLNRFEEAIADYRRAVEVDPSDSSARQALAEILIFANKADEAAGHFERLHREHPDNQAIALGLARCRLQMGEVNAARQILDDLLTRAPASGQALALRGKIALETDDTEQAERLLRKAVSMEPYEKEYLYPFFLCLKRLGKSEEAAEYQARLQRVEADMDRMKVITRQIMVNSSDAQLRAEAGIILLRNGQEQSGLTWLLSALHQDPKSPLARQALVDYYERTGQPAMAAKHRQQLRPTLSGRGAERQ